MVCFALKHYSESLPKAWYARRKAACDALFQDVLPKCNAIIGERYRSLHSGASPRRHSTISTCRTTARSSGPVRHRARLVRASYPQSFSEDHVERDETVRSLTLPAFGSPSSLKRTT